MPLAEQGFDSPRLHQFRQRQAVGLTTPGAVFLSGLDDAGSDLRQVFGNGRVRLKLDFSPDGLEALKQGGDVAELMRRTKEDLFVG